MGDSLVLPPLPESSPDSLDSLDLDVPLLPPPVVDSRRDVVKTASLPNMKANPSRPAIAKKVWERDANSKAVPPAPTTKKVWERDAESGPSFEEEESPTEEQLPPFDWRKALLKKLDECQA